MKKYLSTPPLISSPKIEDVLTIYLAVSDHAVSAALIREEDRQQQPVYYIKKGSWTRKPCTYLWRSCCSHS